MARTRLKKLFTYMKPYLREVTIGVVAIMVVNVLGIIIPLLIRNGVNTLQQAIQESAGGALLIVLVSLIAVLSCVMWLIRMTSRILLFGAGRQIEFDLKQRLFEHVLSMEPAYFTVNTAGDLISRFTSDVDNVRRLVGFAVLSLANTAFAYALTLPVMLSINFKLSLLAISVYPLMLILVRLFSDRLRAEQLEVQQRLSDLSDLIQEDMSGMALIKIYAQEDNERRAFRQLNQQLLDSNLKMAMTRNILFPCLIGIASLSYLLLLWQGASEIAKGLLTVGDFIALLLYVERLIFPTALLGFTITAYQRGEVSVDRIEAILSEQSQIRDQETAQPLPKFEQPPRITAKHLSYTYPGRDRPALQDVNFVIEPGETVAIVGPIGAGKSTLANALPHLLAIEPGQLFLNDLDITQISLYDLRGAIAYVPQDSFLFSMTIKNNIRYGRPDSEQSDLEDAAKQAQIHPEILNFPQQYETLVGERGITLSGGQRQRTALARALLVDAPILILDDALSSVDNETATQILTNLSEGMHRKTLLFITHQLSAVTLADRILVMEAGKVVQSGSHQELIDQPGLYQSLWQQHQLEKVL